MKFDKLIINTALTGIIPTKGQNPHVPITPEEIARDAWKTVHEGASIVHIHARNKDGTTSYSKEIYKETIGRIREKCSDVIITVSTSGRKIKDIKQRMEVLELDADYKPDMASLTLGSMNFKEDYSINSPEIITSLLGAMRDNGIKPELEIFDSGMAHYAKYLCDKGYLGGIHYANLILGSLGTTAATPHNLVHLVDQLPDTVIWAATGTGQFAFHMQCLSIAMGGHVRVGIEDSIFMDKEKRMPATNEGLVVRVRKVAEAMGRAIASPQEVRTAFDCDLRHL